MPQAKIREIFLDRIIKAKGLSQASQLISGIMMPTPAAVLARARTRNIPVVALAGRVKNRPQLLDAGFADVICINPPDGAPDRAGTILKGLPEPYAKRTVEGDIGMRYSAAGIAEAVGIPMLSQLSGLTEERVRTLLAEITTHTDSLPDTDEKKRLDQALASMAIKVGITRHAGTVEKVYTPVGEAYVQSGKDLSRVDKIILTGGSLIHNEPDTARAIASHALYDMAQPASLKPKNAEILIDTQYILSAMGLLSQYAPDTALKIMKKELTSYGTAK